MRKWCANSCNDLFLVCQIKFGKRVGHVTVKKYINIGYSQVKLV